MSEYAGKRAELREAHGARLRSPVGMLSAARVAVLPVVRAAVLSVVRAAALTAAALVALTAALSAGGNVASAQHATAFDIEDGGRAYERACAYCHGPDGDLIAGTDFGRGVYRRPLADEQMADLILAGIPNTPMPPNPGMSEEQALRIVAYLRAMAAGRTVSAEDGDAERGRLLFEGKGACMDCHRVAGRGSRVGPDLSRIGLVRRAVELERSLLDPDAEVQPANRFYRVTPAVGEPITGRLLNHDTFTVQLMDPDERLRSFRKSELLEHGFAESPMPSFRDELSAEEIADVVSYLASLRGDAE
jgi:putative heme-binding domain-containing protein